MPGSIQIVDGFFDDIFSSTGSSDLHRREQVVEPVGIHESFDIHPISNSSRKTNFFWHQVASERPTVSKAFTSEYPLGDTNPLNEKQRPLHELLRPQRHYLSLDSDPAKPSSFMSSKTTVDSGGKKAIDLLSSTEKGLDHDSNMEDMIEKPLHRSPTFALFLDDTSFYDGGGKPIIRSDITPMVSSKSGTKLPSKRSFIRTAFTSDDLDESPSSETEAVDSLKELEIESNGGGHDDSQHQTYGTEEIR